MPFRKTGKNTYKSPSGRKFTGKQVRAYYAGAFDKPKRSPKKAIRKK